MVSQSPDAPSLQRLLALDKSTEHLHVQLSQAADILGLPEEWAVAPRTPAHVKVQGNPRTEWVVKWILGKLKSEKEEGVDARACARVWKMLEVTLHQIPESNAARLLSSHQFLSLIEKALAEQWEEKASHGPQAKRRRVSKVAAVSLNEGQGTSAEERSDLFRHISSVLETTVAKSKFLSSEDPTAAEQMHSVLRSGHPQACRLLKWWIKALTEEHLAEEGRGTSADGLAMLEAMLYVWDLRSIDANVSAEDSAIVFSKECLLPAMDLLYRLTHETKQRKGDRTSTSGISAAMERLIARHLFIPARAAFFANIGEEEEEETKHKQANDPDKILRECLQPLREEGTRIKTVLHAVPHLLEIAIRCSSRSTPKRRIRESPWIQALFTVSAECIGCSTSKPTEETSDEALATLEEMLDTLFKKECSLDIKVLDAIVKHYSNLTSENRKVRVSLIAKVVALDPEVFLPTPSLANPGKASENQPLHELIFPPLHELIFPPLHELIFPILVEDNGASSEESELSLRADIAVSLLKAYSRARDLTGFLSRWYAQLSTRPSTSSITCLCRKLRVEIRGLLEASLIPSQIIELLQVHHNSISGLVRILTSGTEPIEVDETPSSEWAEARASITMLDMLLGALQSDELLEQLSKTLYSILTDMETLVDNDLYRARSDVATAYLCLARLFSMQWSVEQSTLRTSIVVENAPIKLISCAQKSLSQAVRKDTTPAESFAALSLILNVCNDISTVPSKQAAVTTELSKTVALLPDWSEGSPAHSWIFLAFVQFPAVLCFLSSEQRTSLFAALLRSKDLKKTRLSEYHPYLSDSEASVNMLLEVFSEHIFCSAPAEVKDDYLVTLYGSLEAKGRKSKRDTLARSELQYLRAPPGSIPRKHREAVFDRITGLIVNATNDDLTEVTRHLALMIRLMEAPNATAEISTDPKALFKLASSLDSCQNTESTITLYMEELAQRTLSHILAVADQERSVAHLKEVRNQALAHVDSKSFKRRPSTLQVIQVAVRLFDATPFAFELADSSFFAKYTKALESDLLRLDNDLFSKVIEPHAPTFVATVSALVKFPGQGVPHEKWVGRESSLGERATAWRKKLPYLLDEDRIRSDNDLPLLLYHDFVARYHDHQGIRKLLRFSQKILREPLSEPTVHKILHTVQRSIAHLTTEQKASEALELLPKIAGEAEQRNALGIVHAILTTLERPEATPEKLDDPMYTLVGHICALLPTTEDTHAFRWLLDCLDTVLKDKPWLLSQWDIDTITATLAVLASPKGPKLPSAEAGYVYNRLCETANNLISFHRTKLGGRFHILVALLQSLLICIFRPSTRHSTSFISQLPPWLATSHVSLSASHATNFSRVLSSLCSPTVSSVTGRKRHGAAAELTDATKKAKAYAGQYVQNVAMQYCYCQLQGRITPEVRAALMPGLFACLDVIDLETMRAMNAGMDASSRAIWRSLYGEWNRFGKWKER